MSNKNRALLFDVVFLSMICIIGEVINHSAVTRFSSGYYFSVTMIIAFIAIFRTGYMGAVTALVIAVVFSTINEGATFATMMVYVIGNCGILLSGLLLNKVGRDTIKEHSVWAVTYVVTGYLAMVLLRGIVSFILDKSTNLISALFLMLSNEFLSIIAVAMLFSLLAKRKSLLIDIKSLYDDSIEG